MYEDLFLTLPHLIKGENMSKKKTKTKTKTTTDINELKLSRLQKQNLIVLKIHQERYKRAEEIGDKSLMLSASVEISKIEQEIADELSRKSKKLIEEEVEKLQEKE